MPSILNCIVYQHDIWLVLLAGLICVASAVEATVLLRHARGSADGMRLRWTAAAGLASGFGIWATHFVAMLGYRPGLVMGYRIEPTIASLVIAVLMVTAGFVVASYRKSMIFRWLAGALVGCGIVAMHYTGIQAMEMPARLVWAPGWVLLSLACAILPAGFAIILALDRDGPGSAFGAGLLLGLAILLLHFCGMTGMIVIPDARDVATASLLAPMTLGTIIAGAAFGVLTLCVLVALLSAQFRLTIRSHEREFGLLVEGINDCAIYMLDPSGKVVSWNAGAERLKGYTAAEAIGLTFDRFYSDADRAAGGPAASLKIAGETGRHHVEGWRLRKNGSLFWAHATIERVLDERGRLKGYAKVTRDMTVFKEGQDQLAALASNLDTALSNMHQGLVLFDAEGFVRMANVRVHEMFGLDIPNSAIRSSFEDVLSVGLQQRAGGPVLPAVLQEVIDRHRACIARPGGGTLIVPFSNEMTVAISHRPMPDGGWVTTFDDVTERQRTEARIAHMALHDELTDLPNRTCYTRQLNEEMERAGRLDAHVAVLGIDLDRFKEINDIHGHATGDVVLRELGDRMRAACTRGEMVARFGGDEFAALKPYRDEADLKVFIAALETCLKTPIEHLGMTLFTGASIGVAVYPEHGETSEVITANADLAMYRAKESISSQTCFYSQEMDQAARLRRVLTGDLREAISRDEMSLAYQVQRSIVSGEVTGYEALLRWAHPRYGAVSPADFIPIAEESGEILRIGEWVLRSACHEAAGWESACKIAVNLSPVQLMQPDLIAIVQDALVASGLSPRRLELEITETALIADKARALHVLRQIKGLGVTIAIDDFGTGYSSLATLNAFPFDKIKIDRSFLLESETSHQARAIIRAVLALGRSLDVPVLAEGLESPEQLEMLRSEGCDEAQGFYFGRPMAVTAIPGLRSATAA